jgi:hypothetical protein
MHEPSSNAPHGSAAFRSEGVTMAERYLAGLCKRTFLSLWSYPGIYRDQGRHEGKGIGKEVCDLLVVFEKHIFIFSDKDCRFDTSKSIEIGWRRWYKKAITKSAEQVWGAERWIRTFPNRLFLDNHCTIPLPIRLPDLSTAIFHRIVVGHDAARACREALGGSGSLMLHSDVVGDMHLERPFTIGQIDPSRGYVHVFDDTTLTIVMSTLDTISDFAAYLMKKERFLTREMSIAAAGEEELLAFYLKNMSDAGEHDFVIKGDYDHVSLPEGLWDDFASSPERLAQIEHNKISYLWDGLIEKFAHHAMTGTQYFTSGRPLHEQEIMFRFMAREPRTRRRGLAADLLEVLERSIHSTSPWDARVICSSNPGDPHYVFLFVKRPPGVSDEEYRDVRKNLLSEYCYVAKLRFPDATHIVGMASEAERGARRSEDLLYLDASNWCAADFAKAREIQEKSGLLKTVKSAMTREYEYPIDHEGKPRRKTLSRNSPCWCGSGKRFKRCHGEDLFRKRGKH